MKYDQLINKQYHITKTNKTVLKFLHNHDTATNFFLEVEHII